MAGGRRKGRGRGRQTVWGASGTVLRDLGGVFLYSRHSAPFTSFNPHPEPWSRYGNQQGLQMGQPRLAERKSFAHDHLACVRTGIPAFVPRSVSHSGHLASSPLDGWQQEAPDGGLCPSAGAVLVPPGRCLATHLPVSAVPASPSAPQEGACLWGPGWSWQDQRCPLLLPRLLNLPLPPPPSF